MELGGNAPFVVFGDADLDKAVDGAMLAKMRNIGEACTAANRFIVHESVADEFSRRLAERMGAMTIGRGITDGVTVGPLVDSAAIDKVTELVADAVDQGATVLTGGTALDGPGTSTRRPCSPASRPRPRCSARRSSGRSRRSSRSVPTRTASTRPTTPSTASSPTPSPRTSPARLTVAEKLQTGMVGINQGIVSNPAAPFGGVKASGLGREGGTEGIEEYLETKYVGIKL